MAQSSHQDGGFNGEAQGPNSPEDAIDQANWLDDQADGGQKAQARRGGARRSAGFQRDRVSGNEAEMSRQKQGRRVSKLFVENHGSQDRPAWFVTSYDACWDDFQQDGGA